MENNQKQGGIRAKSIQADNVVSGVQLHGGEAQQAAALVNLAQAIRRGEISADEIKTHNLVSGFQYLADSDKTTIEDIRKELAAFRTEVNAAIAAQEFPDQVDVEEVRESLEIAEKELAKPQPDGQQVLHKLDEVNTILTKSAEMAQSAGKIGAFVIQLAPVAATLWQVAQKLFGL